MPFQKKQSFVQFPSVDLWMPHLILWRKRILKVKAVFEEKKLYPQVVEVLATDDDDRSRGNGPSFVFRMDPNAADVIRASFKVEHDPSKYFLYL